MTLAAVKRIGEHFAHHRVMLRPVTGRSAVRQSRQLLS